MSILSLTGELMITCPFCQASLADSKQGYASHIETYHSVDSPYMVQRVIRPIRTSKRTTAEIVAEFERRNKENLYVPGAHIKGCSCMACFNAGLDAIIRRQEEDLQ